MVQLINSIIAVVLSLSTFSAAIPHSAGKTYRPSAFGYFEDCQVYSGNDPNPAPAITDEHGFLRYLVKRDIPQSNRNYPTSEYEFRGGRMVFVGRKYLGKGARCKWPPPKYRYCLWHEMFNDHKIAANQRHCSLHTSRLNPGAAPTCNCWVGIDHAELEYRERRRSHCRTNQGMEPLVGEDCDSGLYAGTVDWTQRLVCAGVEGFEPFSDPVRQGDASDGADL